MASARMGLRTALFTLNLDLIAQMSCNPAIGGIAKGHLVREVDALGGIMGEVADACGIQFRLLNTSRGPAVWSPRAQCDKALYRVKMREVLEGQPDLFIKQAEVVDLFEVERVRETENSRAAACHRSAPARWPRRPRRRGGRHHRDVPQRHHPLRRAAVRRGAQRRAGQRPAGRGAQAAGPARVPPQDRNSAAPRRPHHRLDEVRGAAGGHRSHSVQLSSREQDREQRGFPRCPRSAATSPPPRRRPSA